MYEYLGRWWNSRKQIGRERKRQDKMNGERGRGKSGGVIQDAVYHLTLYQGGGRCGRFETCDDGLVLGGSLHGAKHELGGGSGGVAGSSRGHGGRHGGRGVGGWMVREVGGH